MTRPLLRLLLPSLMLAQALAAPAGAADAPPGLAACQACHGPAGIAPGAGTPNLAGQKAAYLSAQLAAFKSGARKHDLMSAVAAQLSDDDMKSLAQYWSAQPATPAAAVAATPIHSRMVLPADFPAGFTAYETVDSASDGTVTRRYANRPALEAARSGKPLPAGSMIVVVNYKREADGKAGAVQSYSAMASQAGWGEAIPALIRNGDWDYALFDAAKARRDALNQAQCLACHRPAATDSYVFTLKALKAAAAKPAG